MKSMERWTKRIVAAYAVASGCVIASGCERKQDPPDAPALAQETSEAQTKLDVDDPQACAPCHGALVEEWTESMHARAHHERDPIYGSMRALRMKKQGAEVASKCASCHTPRAGGDDASAAALAGVSCATCHAISSVRPGEGHGAQALTWAEDGAMRGAKTLAPGASPAHGTGDALEAIADGQTLCLTCHGELEAAPGVVACSTGAEHELGGEAQTCVECHMPEVDGPAGAVGSQLRHRSHAFPGPHRAWYQRDASQLARAVVASAELNDGVVTVRLKNESAHAFPTGFPGRYAVVIVRALDAQGEELWSNAAGGPASAGEGAFLGKIYHDANGEPVPAAFATSLASDTRLETKSPRTLEIAVGEVEEASSVEVKLVYGLLPGPLAKKLGLSEAPEATPKVAWETTLTP